MEGWPLLLRGEALGWTPRGRSSCSTAAAVAAVGACFWGRRFQKHPKDCDYATDPARARRADGRSSLRPQRRETGGAQLGTLCPMARQRTGAVFLVALLLTGCSSSNNDKPRVLPVISPGAVNSLPPAGAAPTGMAAPTPQGAAAFARHWFDTLNGAARTGRTVDLSSLSSSDCHSCTTFVNGIRQAYLNGRIEGGVFKVLLAEAPGFPPDAPAVRVNVVYNVSPTQIIDKSGIVRKTVPQRSGINADATLRRSGQSWLMQALVVQP